MFGSLGVPELLLIFVVILIVFGPRRIPEIGQMLGKALGEFRKATDDLKNTIEREVRLEELKAVAPVMMTPLESVSRNEPLPSPAPPAVAMADVPGGMGDVPVGIADVPGAPETPGRDTTEADAPAEVKPE
jgi:TatA/E family protein of Tat protein translocase